MTAIPITLFGDETPAESPAGGRRRRRNDADTTPPIPCGPDRLLTPIEAAAVLGIGRSKFYELMARDAINSVKVDRCRRIRRSELDRFISALPPAYD